MSARSDSASAYCCNQLAHSLPDNYSNTLLKKFDDAALRIVKTLAEAERAHDILRTKGYGKSWMQIDEIAKLVPDKGLNDFP
jgi:hypothetical protein